MNVDIEFKLEFKLSFPTTSVIAWVCLFGTAEIMCLVISLPFLLDSCLDFFPPLFRLNKKEPQFFFRTKRSVRCAKILSASLYL